MSIPVGTQTLLGVALGPSYTGLAATVQYRLTRANGTLLQDWTNTGVFELGAGGYAAPYTFTAEGVYALEGRETSLGLATNVPAVIQVSTDTDAIRAKTDLIPAAGPASAADYTTARAAKLDDLDAAVTSRLAASAYVAPDNATVAATKADTAEILDRTPVIRGADE